MNTFETIATVEDQGQICVAGLPFAPGTQVEVIVNAKADGAAAGSGRVDRLLAALDKGRNVIPLGAFDRGELYDRDVLR